MRNLDLALAVSYPGRPVERAACLVLKARSLAALGRLEEAVAELTAAENVFLELGYDRHPHLAMSRRREASCSLEARAEVAYSVTISSDSR